MHMQNLGHNPMTKAM